MSLQCRVYSEDCYCLYVRLHVPNFDNFQRYRTCVYFLLTYMYYFAHSDFEGIEVHSRKVFNVPTEKTAATKDSEESIGPMVRDTCHYKHVLHYFCIVIILHLVVTQYTVEPQVVTISRNQPLLLKDQSSKILKVSKSLL